MADNIADLNKARADRRKVEEFRKLVRGRQMGRPTIIDDDKLVADLLCVISQMNEGVDNG